MLTNERIETILKDSGTLMTGHFLYTSGRHGDKYFEKARILQNPAYVAEIMGHLAGQFKDDNVDIVIAPAVGAVILGYELARQLGVTCLFTEREDDKMALRRGFVIPAGARVVVAEDVITTGGSVQEVIDIVKQSGGTLVGVALIVDRTGGTLDFGAKTAAAYTTVATSYEADKCPICAAGDVPLVKPGSRMLPIS
ncbi:MAG: orotate phosphoribosyltransferase [Defluviitaleaceae bacterium]|nr:orotate phosphoribosyltransferase [Defluviitaleaceae bacterium]